MGAGYMIASMADYYPVIFRAVSQLPSNTRKTRRVLYDRARTALAAQPISESQIKRELRALELAIRSVEKSPNEIPGTRGSTGGLIISIVFFKVLWVLDPTSMSLHWVVRPWNRLLIEGAAP
jgi:hypothetical protein